MSNEFDFNEDYPDLSKLVAPRQSSRFLDDDPEDEDDDDIDLTQWEDD